MCFDCNNQGTVELNDDLDINNLHIPGDCGAASFTFNFQGDGGGGGAHNLVVNNVLVRSGSFFRFTGDRATLELKNTMTIEGQLDDNSQSSNNARIIGTETGSPATLRFASGSSWWLGADPAFNDAYLENVVVIGEPGVVNMEVQSAVELNGVEFQLSCPFDHGYGDMVSVVPTTFALSDGASWVTRSNLGLGGADDTWTFTNGSSLDFRAGSSWTFSSASVSSSSVVISGGTTVTGDVTLDGDDALWVWDPAGNIQYSGIMRANNGIVRYQADAEPIRFGVNSELVVNGGLFRFHGTIDGGRITFISGVVEVSPTEEGILRDSDGADEQEADLIIPASANDAILRMSLEDADDIHLFFTPRLTLIGQLEVEINLGASASPSWPTQLDGKGYTVFKWEEKNNGGLPMELTLLGPDDALADCAIVELDFTVQVGCGDWIPVDEPPPFQIFGLRWELVALYAACALAFVGVLGAVVLGSFSDSRVSFEKQSKLRASMSALAGDRRKSHMISKRRGSKKVAKTLKADESKTQLKSFEKLLLEKSDFVHALGEAVGKDAREAVARSLVRAFEGRGKGHVLLRSLARGHVKSKDITSANDAFRAASFVSVVIGLWMRLVGEQFMHDAIGKVIARVAKATQIVNGEKKSKKSKSKDKVAAVARANDQLKPENIARHAINSIMSARVPSAVQHALSIVREALVLRKAENRAEVVVGQLMLNRFLIPAMTLPHKAGLSGEVPAAVSMLLLQAAKIIGTLATPKGSDYGSLATDLGSAKNPKLEEAGGKLRVWLFDLGRRNAPENSHTNPDVVTDGNIRSAALFVAYEAALNNASGLSGLLDSKTAEAWAKISGTTNKAWARKTMISLGNSSLSSFSDDDQWSAGGEWEAGELADTAALFKPVKKEEKERKERPGSGGQDGKKGGRSPSKSRKKSNSVHKKRKDSAGDEGKKRKDSTGLDAGEGREKRGRSRSRSHQVK